jgi:hypothetical protein
MAWHLKNGLALPDHLQTESGSTPQGARPTIENTPAKPAGAPQTDPQALPAPYTDIPMGDAKDILDWEPDPLSDPKLIIEGERVSNTTYLHCH